MVLPRGATMAPSEVVSKALQLAAKQAAQAAADDAALVDNQTSEPAKKSRLDEKLEDPLEGPSWTIL